LRSTGTPHSVPTHTTTSMSGSKEDVIMQLAYLDTMFARRRWVISISSDLRLSSELEANLPAKITLEAWSGTCLAYNRGEAHTHIMTTNAQYLASKYATLATLHLDLESRRSFILKNLKTASGL